MTVCEKCGDTGKLRYSIAPTPGTIDLGDGMTMVDMGGSGTAACECVRDLPAIDGKATWWESEQIYSENVPVPIGCDSIDVAVDGEVPRDEHGRRVHRVGENAYYPTLIRLEASRPCLTLFADDARALAKALIEAADACEAADSGLWESTIEKGGKV